jgi:outer membrane protein OmpA-like peptidoglycan-associated protein
MQKILIILITFFIISCQKEQNDILKDDFEDVAVNDSEINADKDLTYSEAAIDAFLSVLEYEYKKRSVEFQNDGYTSDAKTFLRKSKLAQERDATHFNENSFSLSQTKKDEAQLSGLFLDKIRGNTIIFNLFPESLARMQSYYDCMLIEMRDSSYKKNARNFCTKQFDKMQKSFQRTGFTKNIKYDKEVRETFVIYFDLGSGKISSENSKTLQEIARKATSMKKYKIKIVSLADKTGSKEINRKISRTRGENAKNKLMKFGVPSSAIEMEYLADDFSLIDTPKAEKFNRRVVIDLIG